MLAKNEPRMHVYIDGILKPSFFWSDIGDSGIVGDMGCLAAMNRDSLFNVDFGNPAGGYFSLKQHPPPRSQWW